MHGGWSATLADEAWLHRPPYETHANKDVSFPRNELRSLQKDGNLRKLFRDGIRTETQDHK